MNGWFEELLAAAITALALLFGSDYIKPRRRPLLAGRVQPRFPIAKRGRWLPAIGGLGAGLGIGIVAMSWSIQIRSTNPDGVALTFYSGWDNSTGVSSAALHDGTIWAGDDLCSSAQGFDSVQTSATAPGTPPAGVTNAMRHEYRLNGGVGAGLCGGISDITLTAWTDVYLRVWMYSTETENIINHALTFGRSNFQFQAAREGFATGWIFKVKQATADIPRNGQFAWNPGDTTTSVRDTLNHNEWYRVEFFIDFLGDSVGALYQMYPRIYNAAGTLIHDYRTFLGSEHSGGSGVTLGTHYDGGDGFVVDNAVDWTLLQLAQEGALGETDNRGEFIYWTGMALSEEGWIGDFVP